MEEEISPEDDPDLAIQRLLEMQRNAWWPKKQPPKPVRTLSPEESRRRRRKGKSGEREVVTLWRQNGWPKARRQPGSGSYRPYGAGDVSPWPGDVGGIKPWLCEVKLDERMNKAGRGWTGEAFIKATLKDLFKLWHRHRRVVGVGQVNPVMFGRAASRPGVPVQWRVFIPEHLFQMGMDSRFITMTDENWVEINPWLFFGHLAPGPG